MAKIKERYLWAAFIVLIIAVSLYLRYYYQTPLSINVSMASFSSAVYPYQTIPIPISILNTGSSTINNISFGLYINGNITRTYRAYLPVGKRATIPYNFTPTSSGS